MKIVHLINIIDYQIKSSPVELAKFQTNVTREGLSGLIPMYLCSVTPHWILKAESIFAALQAEVGIIYHMNSWKWVD